MRQSSVIIHKGRKEEKYEIYIEDYVMSLLKEETGTLDLSEVYFFGFRENNNQRYVIYGAGRNRNLAVFDKYSLLDEIGCRLTQAGPVFLVREENGIYEIQGYDVFYQDNKEMQSYLIDYKKESVLEDKNDQVDKASRNVQAYKMDNRKLSRGGTPHSAISVQLGLILVVLIAIVINSTNSYDKMDQLNQSASEVLFAIENQEATDVANMGTGQDEIVVERHAVQEDVQSGETDGDEAFNDAGQEEDVLKLVALENEVHAEGSANGDASGTDESARTTDGDAAVESDVSDTAKQEEKQDVVSDNQEGVEALSRNVARYYEVERGDTLYTISREIYGDITHVQKICELNQISDPDHIRYGQKIILP